MKALFIGLGSIGTRHLINLSHACVRRGINLTVDAVRSDLSRPVQGDVHQLIENQYDEFAELKSYDVAFITNPTHLHARAIRLISGKANALFIEKPIFDSTDYALSDLGIDEEKKIYVAAPLRWCGVMLALKALLPRLQAFSVRAICSSYLPEWRPNTDYRLSYSGRSDMGGGVSLDLIHEWDYLVDLFGIPDQIHNFRGTYSNLGVSSDDISVYIARYPTLIAELHLDYFGRQSRRRIEILCSSGMVIADFVEGTLTHPDGTIQRFDEKINERYIREMDYFIDYIHGELSVSINSPQRAISTLRLALGVI